jgi:hypothetical protein
VPTPFDATSVLAVAEIGPAALLWLTPLPSKVAKLFFKESMSHQEQPK